MKKTRLNVFYHLGEGLEDLHALRTDMELGEAIMSMIRPQQWLAQFDWECKDVPLPATRDAARALLNFVNRWLTAGPGFDPSQKFNQEDMRALHILRELFMQAFEREEANLGVFIVTAKGLYDTKLLLEKPEEEFPEKIRSRLPKQMLFDFREAARALAFELPTACAFHVCRGTEALLLHYHETLVGHPWQHKKKDWKIYVEQLAVAGAPKKITSRLDEIRDMDRNTYIHPDQNVTLEEAPALFKLCSAVILYIGQELERLIP